VKKEPKGFRQSLQLSASTHSEKALLQREKRWRDSKRERDRVLKREEVRHRAGGAGW